MAALSSASVLAAQDRDAAIAGTIRVFSEIGVTAEDLRQWAPWCPALGELADAMDAGTTKQTADRSAGNTAGRPRSPADSTGRKSS